MANADCQIKPDPANCYTKALILVGAKKMHFGKRIFGIAVPLSGRFFKEQFRLGDILICNFSA